MQYLASSANPGRFDNRLLVFESEDTYLPIIRGNKWFVGGGSVESTVHADTLYAMGRAEVRGFPQYSLRNYGLWNARYVLISNSRNVLFDALEGAGFRRQMDDGMQSLLVSDRPSSFFTVHDRSILVIGRGAEIATTLYPWASQGTSWYLEDYPPEFLATFKGIILSSIRVRDPAAVDRIVRDLLVQGKLVLVEEPAMNHDRLLGAAKQYLEITSHPSLSVTDTEGILKGVPSITFKSFLPGWRPPTHTNLDVTLVSARVGNRTIPVLGYNRLEEGRVYFIGLSLFNHALLNRDDGAIALGEAVLNLAQPRKNLWLEPFVVQEEDWGPDALVFRYSSTEARPVIVSMTYSPHWRVTIDGQSTRAYNYENLNLLFLPAGEHQVEFRYGTTPIQEASAVASLAFLAGVVAVLLLLWSPLHVLERWRVRDLLLAAWRYEYPWRK
jgi:hypothetical protein